MAEFAKAFERRTHLLPAAPEFSQVGMPVVAMCGTVFVPKDWDPGDKFPLCRPCHEAEFDLTLHKIDVLVKRADDLKRMLDDATPRGGNV